MAVLMLLVGCGGGDGGDGGGNSSGGNSSGDDGDPSEPTPTPVETSYTVPNASCPGDYGTGLTITTDVPAEVQYLDEIVACTNNAGATYLYNDSDAVWNLHRTGANSPTVTYWDSATLGWKAWSFEQIVSPEQALLVPGGSVTVNLPPESLEWDLDLVKSVAWQGHDLVVEKLQSAGKAAVIAALKRETQAGAALVACTFAVHELAKTKTDLENADLTEVVLDGLGVTVSGSNCTIQAAEVVRVEPQTGQSVALADDIAELKQQTALLSKVETKLNNASRMFKVINLVRLAPGVP
jgi:hypothetical protein